MAQVVLLLGLCMVIYFVNLGQWDLWNPDEPRYAEVSREMVNGGDWILMHRNGNLYTDKPPLFFWAVAILPSSGEGLPLCNKVSFCPLRDVDGTSHFFIGKRLYSSRTGFLSGSFWQRVVNLPFFRRGAILIPPLLSLPPVRCSASSIGINVARKERLPSKEWRVSLLWILHRNGA